MTKKHGYIIKIPTKKVSKKEIEEKKEKPVNCLLSGLRKKFLEEVELI